MNAGSPSEFNSSNCLCSFPSASETSTRVTARSRSSPSRRSSAALRYSAAAVRYLFSSNASSASANAACASFSRSVRRSGALSCANESPFDSVMAIRNTAATEANAVPARSLRFMPCLVILDEPKLCGLSVVILTRKDRNCSFGLGDDSGSSGLARHQGRSICIKARYLATPRPAA